MSTTIMRHPDPATLMSFAAGSIAEPLAAVMAAHVSMCEECRAELVDLELLGAALMSRAEPVLESAPTQAPERPTDNSSSEVARPRAAASDKLPAPIAAAFHLSFDAIPWKRLGPGIWHHRLPVSPSVEGDLRLLKIGPGRVMPDHGHGGSELTLVLDGAYNDATGSYRRGDMQDVDEEIEHKPVADKVTGCICLIASERPVRFKSLVGRLLQPWTGM